MASQKVTPAVPVTLGRDCHRLEIEQGQRFRFGENWAAFLATLDDDRIETAMASLRTMLDMDSLEGRTFLDAGSGSGLFSLAARGLGARVVSFDFDPASVACTSELKRRYYAGDDRWEIREGSVLDPDFVSGLPTADIVYSWGVLHHTGAMWRALELIETRVAAAGRIFVALYNDQGMQSRVWTRIKRAYCGSSVGRAAVTAVFVPVFFLATALAGAAAGDPRKPFRRYRRQRGMSIYHDWIDWLGGYPFEYARPQHVFEFFRKRGYTLQQLRTTNRLGCNEFVFQRI